MLKRKAQLDTSLIRNVFFALIAIAILIGLYLILSSKVRALSSDIPAKVISIISGGLS